MEGLVPVRDSEAVSIIEKETLHVDVDVHGFSDDFISKLIYYFKLNDF